jgi:hypothetical protein
MATPLNISDAFGEIDPAATTAHRVIPAQVNETTMVTDFPVFSKIRRGVRIDDV